MQNDFENIWIISTRIKKKRVMFSQYTLFRLQEPLRG